MSVRNSLFVIAFASASVQSARADGIFPIEAENIGLGKVTGIAYYTVEQDGFHAVTTLAQGEAGAWLASLGRSVNSCGMKGAANRGDPARNSVSSSLVCHVRPWT
jgi:hypothetical protein